MKKIPVTASLLTLATGIALGTVSSAALAQDAWPSQPITIISGFPGGAATDIYSRKLGTELSAQLKVPFVYDTRTGAGGNIASALVAKAKPDGYTFLIGTAGTHAINAALYKTLPFDVVKDFSRIALLGNLPNVLLINPAKHPDIKNCKDLLALAKQKPGTLNYASTGNGASGHLAGVQFAGASQSAFTHIPYRGQGPAMTATLAGDVDFFFNQSSPSIPLVQSGKVKALAVTSPQRIAALPDVPTVAEACGLPGFQSTTWYGILAPAGLPADIQNKMSTAILNTIKTESFRKWLISQGIAPVEDGSPAAFAKVQAADIISWAKIVKESGATVD